MIRRQKSRGGVVDGTLSAPCTAWRTYCRGASNSGTRLRVDVPSILRPSLAASVRVMYLQCCHRIENGSAGSSHSEVMPLSAAPGHLLFHQRLSSSPKRQNDVHICVGRRAPYVEAATQFAR